MEMEPLGGEDGPIGLCLDPEVHIITRAEDRGASSSSTDGDSIASESEGPISTDNDPGNDGQVSE